jgi:protein-tyrosine-phosphatase
MTAEHRFPSAEALREPLAADAQRLALEFRGIFSAANIRRAIRESVAHYGDLQTSGGTRYFPALVYRYTYERLEATARWRGMMPKDHPVILYVCVQNAGRSQMAAAFTRQLGAGRIDVRSAGSAPAQEIHPTVVQVMEEVGIDLSPEYPKPIADELVREADVVITMGCGDACPVYPGTKYEDWELDDPAGQPIEKVRELRDEIRARVQKLVGELTVPA